MGNGEVVTKNFDGVTFVAGYVGHVNHTDIHADVTYVWRWHSVDQAIPSAITQSAIETVGIPNGKRGYARGTREHASPTISHGCRVRDVTNLENRGLKCGYVVNRMVIDGRNSVKTEPQSHHVEMIFREALNTCAIADVAQHLVREVRLKVFTCRVKNGKLLVCVSIKILAVTSRKVGEYGAWE